MNRILITTHRLEMYAGAQLVCLDLAAEFAHRGFEVFVGSFVINRDFVTLLDQLQVNFVNLNSPVFQGPTSFDLIWANHNTTIDNLFKWHAIHANKVIFASLSPVEQLECPPDYSERLSLILANSFETRDAIISYGFNENLIDIFPNPAGQVFFDHSKKLTLNSPKKIAIISNHAPKELKELSLYFEKCGVLVDYFGVGYTVVRIIPDILLKYDMVITIGRTVQQCLALGVPVFCYDHFGGPGFITPSNIEESGYYNFSGRCTKQKMSVSEMLNRIEEEYPCAVTQATKLMQLARSKFHLPSVIDKILSQLEERPCFIPIPEHLTLLYKRLYSVSPPYSVSPFEGKSAQIFFDVGSSYSEVNSISLDITSNGIYNFCIDLTQWKNLKSIRFDPLNDYCVCHIHKLELVNLHETYDLLPFIKTSGIIFEDHCIGFLTQDPQVYFINIDESLFSYYSELKFVIDYQKVGVIALEFFCTHFLNLLERNKAYVNYGCDRYKNIFDERDYYISTLISELERVRVLSQNLQCEGLSLSKQLSYTEEKLSQELKKNFLQHEQYRIEMVRAQAQLDMLTDLLTNNDFSDFNSNEKVANPNGINWL